MKDIYVPKKVPRIEVREKLHGHTRIDLFNTKTKKYERVEHDNMFTDGIEYYFSENGAAGNSPFSYSDSSLGSLWQKALGGILLFDTELPTTAKYMPAGTTMIANGSYGVANSGAVTEFGSYNSVESVITGDSISMVYDWGTSQGNGSIASVALTTAVGGYIGYGNVTSGQRMSSQKSMTESTNKQAVIYGASGGRLNGIYHDNGIWIEPGQNYNEGYTFTDTFNLMKYYVPFDSVDVFRTYRNQQIDTFPITVSGGRLVITSLVRYINGTPKIGFIINTAQDQYISPNATFYFVIADVFTKTYSTYALTRKMGSSSSDEIKIYDFDDTYVYLKVRDTVCMVEYSSDTWASTTIPFSNAGRQASYFTDEFRFIGTNSIRDLTLGRNAPINGTGGYNPTTYTLYKLSYDKESDTLMYQDSGGYGTTVYDCYMIKHPCRLMTINNLDSPVTKTADKTMKVTYTITRAS